jgi:hypothetical protein
LRYAKHDAGSLPAFAYCTSHDEGKQRVTVAMSPDRDAGQVRGGTRKERRDPDEGEQADLVSRTQPLTIAAAKQCQVVVGQPGALGRHE